MNFTEISIVLKQTLKTYVNTVVSETNDTEVLEDKLDLQKINRLIAAIKGIEQNQADDNREIFIQRFNKAHGTKILMPRKKEKRSFYYYVGKVACWAVSFAIAFAGINTITGMATGKSIFDRIFETWHSMEYGYYKETSQTSAVEAEMNFQELQQNCSALSFDELRKEISYQYNFLEPYYIPDGYNAEPWISYTLTDTDFRFWRIYTAGEERLIFRCQLPDDNYQRSLAGLASSEEHIQINGYDASIFQVGNNMVTIYQVEGLVYSFSCSDPHVTEEEIIKIIENMKGS